MVKESSNAAELQAYLEAFPRRPYAEAARQRLSELRAPAGPAAAAAAARSDRPTPASPTPAPDSPPPSSEAGRPALDGRPR